MGYTFTHDVENLLPQISNSSTKLNMIMKTNFEISAEKDITDETPIGYKHYGDRYNVITNPFIYLLYQKSLKSILFIGINRY